MAKAVNHNIQFKRGLGLFVKVFLAVIFMIGVVMGSVTWVVHTRVRDALLTQMRIKGLTVARGLAGNAAEALAVSDRLMLAELVDKAVKQEPGIRLAALVDLQNHILAHTDFKLEGQTYSPANGRTPDSAASESVVEYNLGSEPCLDFAVPIRLEDKAHGETKHLGVAHVVYLLTPLQEEIARTLEYIIFIALGGMFLGIVVTIFLVRRITHPIGQLAKAAEAVGGGNFDSKVRIHSRDELGQLAASFNQMTVNLKQAQADLIIKEHLQHEMEMAREIQAILIPKSVPVIPNYSVGMLYLGAEEVSGDYLDFIDLGQGYWGMVVADVSGKGVPGGLVMAQIRSILRTLAPSSHSPVKILVQTQEKLHGDIRKDMFATISYMVLDTKQHELFLTRAGHPAALVYRQATQQCELLLPSGVAMGIAEPEIFATMLSEKKFKLESGDFILLYTDGVDESCNNSQELFGNARLVQCMKAAAHLPADQIVQSIDRNIRDFIQNAPQHDDMTMIVLKYENPGPAKGTRGARSA